MSVFKRKWKTRKGVEKEAWAVDYTDTAGKRRRKTFAKKKDAEAFHQQTSVDVRKGVHVPDSATVTVQKAGELWLETGEAAGLERSTLAQYRQHLDLHIVPDLGATKLNKLTVPGVRAFQDRMRGKGMSPALLRKVTVSLGSLLADAQERGLVAGNPVRDMASRRKVANGEKRQKRRLQVGVDIPTPAEIRGILEHSTGQWRPFIVTAIFTGMRASELRGLRWADVDLEARAIHVRQRADRFRTIGMPKSDAGQRTIPVPPMVVSTLKEWRATCPASGLDLVFPTPDGAVRHHHHLRLYALIPPQIAAGVVNEAGEAKYTKLHALRHFYASWLINRTEDGGLGLPPKVVQERMGHSTITMTMDTYGHLFPSSDDGDELAAAERALMASAT